MRRVAKRTCKWTQSTKKCQFAASVAEPNEAREMKLCRLARGGQTTKTQVVRCRRKYTQVRAKVTSHKSTEVCNLRLLATPFRSCLKGVIRTNKKRHERKQSRNTSLLVTLNQYRMKKARVEFDSTAFTCSLSME